ncbi:Na+/H+ antiporter [Crocosphaera subtropica ATCC 51142]|uniref:Na+/H+ antiporter n=1 Tax=Crocosphaera subtropica (strain ATCC 51142 / BH68) TaxID=43989 RepID=B1WWC4_CROS5|nr:cation:proton antiporter [Crocosphaera subtropica]ACB54052.1 Na+/H+ antiporter [Crocosphaera subtropica ATCC 51142]
MENLLSILRSNPLVSFTILLLVILTLPPIFERLRLPGLVGLLFAGVILGKDGLYLLDADSESIDLLAEIGKIYLMFVAGLEIDLAEFRKTKDRSVVFGFLTFCFPLLMGTYVGLNFGFGLNSSILIGSLLASHTLLGFPIVQRLGMVKNEAVMVTIGATIFTDIAALLVLAISVSIHRGNFSPVSLIIQLVALGFYSIIVLFGFDWLGKEYFRRTGDEESNQFLFVLLAVFLASIGAQLINVDKIVGAFLAGLAVNDVVGNGPVKEKIEFVGGTLFIPFFFVGMGLLLDIPAFIKTIRFELPLVIGIVGGLIVAKFMAAIAVKFIYRYTWPELFTMWSLSLPQVAATLAAALAAYQIQNVAGERLINEAVFNSVIVLMLITSILGPVLTAQFATKLPLSKTIENEAPGTIRSTLDEWLPQLKSETKNDSFNIVIPIYNPHTQRDLIEMGALLAKKESGIIVPVSIATAGVHMDDPQLDGNLKRSQMLLDRAREISQEFSVDTEPIIRIDDDIAYGISRTAKEKNAHLIIMGWSRNTGLKARLFGTVLDTVFWSSHCPVAVMRLLDNPTNLHRILLPVKNLSKATLETIKFAKLFADANQGSITLLHISDRQTPSQQVTEFKTALSNLVTDYELSEKCKIKMIIHDAPAQVIIRASHQFDLVILRSFRRRTAGGLAVSDITTEVLKKLSCSLVLFGQPHS